MLSKSGTTLSSFVTLTGQQKRDLAWNSSDTKTPTKSSLMRTNLVWRSVNWCNHKKKNGRAVKQTLTTLWNPTNGKPTEHFAGIFVQCVKNGSCKGTDDVDVERWVGEEMQIRQREKYAQGLDVRRRRYLQARYQRRLDNVCNLNEWINFIIVLQPKAWIATIWEMYTLYNTIQCNNKKSELMLTGHVTASV